MKTKSITYIALSLILLVSCQDNSMATMPDFKLKLADGTITDVGKSLEGYTSLIIHFDSDCKGCQDETQKILDNINEFQNVEIYFVSIQDFEHINLFREYFELNRYPNITIGQDYNNSIISFFKTGSTPLSVLVDGDKKIRVVIEGIADIPELLAMINDINTT